MTASAQPTDDNVQEDRKDGEIGLDQKFSFHLPIREATLGTGILVFLCFACLCDVYTPFPIWAKST